MDCNKEELSDQKEDNRLANWKKWIAVRKKFQEHITCIQQRRPIEQIMNSPEFYRFKIEDRLIFEYARIPQVLSARGCPGFWTLPNASKKFPSLCSVLTKEQTCTVPEIEYVRLPTYIKQEINIYSTDEKLKDTIYFKSSYRKDLLQKLKKDINRIEPHVPLTDKLIIIGNQPYVEEIFEKESSFDIYEKPSGDANIDYENEKIIRMEHYTSDTVNQKYFNIDDINLIPSLQIEDSIFSPNEQNADKEYKLFVKYEIGKDDIVQNFITLKNLGNTTLKYYWRMHIQEKPLLELIPHRYPQCKFIFEKNETNILPEQTKILKIYFLTEDTGYTKEIWELYTKPNIFTSGKFTIKLMSIAEVANSAEEENAILKRIYEGMTNTAVEDTLLSIVQDANLTMLRRTYRDDDKLRYTEKDIFEAMNAEFGPPGSTPKIFNYEKMLVSQLRILYRKILSEIKLKTLGPWNYKIKDLYTLVNEVQNSIERDNFRTKLDEIVGKLYVSEMIENVEDHKYFVVHNLLCTMINKISAFVYEIRSYYNYPLIEVYPAVNEEVLFQQEELINNTYRTFHLYPDFHVKEHVKPVCILSEFDRPPLEALKNIPFNDVNARYLAYHTIMNPSKVEPLEEKDAKGNKRKGRKGGKKVAKGKAKGQPQKKGKKEKEDAKGKDDKGAKKIVFPVRPEFVEESFTQLLKDKIEIKPSYISDSIEGLSIEASNMYYVNIYSVVYNMLCKTVTEVASLLDRINTTKHISRKMLRNCIDCGVSSMTDLSKQKKNLPTYKLKQMYKPDSEESSEIMSVLSTLPSIGDSLTLTASGSHISTNFSRTTSEFLIPRDYVDAQTETACGVLYTPKIKNMEMQTEFGDDEFDLVAIVEKEVSATSIQEPYKGPRIEKSTQFDQCELCNSDHSEIGNMG